MEINRFASGDILFREGDVIDRVFFLRSGEVEILRMAGDQTVMMGKVIAGQFCGEMGVIEERARRAATARASTDVAAEILSPSEFLDRLDQAPGLARDLIRQLSQRLRAADERIAGDETRRPAPAGTTARLRRVREMALSEPVLPVQVIAAGPALRQQMPVPVPVVDFPFVVGRRSSRGEQAPRRQPDLLLDDSKPYRLSRDHFMILTRDDAVFLRDLFSRLGTIVNDVSIGEHSGQDEVRLRQGENTVVAGGRGSPFSFAVMVG